jgi:hypothetical protein
MGDQVKSYEKEPVYLMSLYLFDVFSWSWALHWNNLEGFDGCAHIHKYKPPYFG